MHTLDTRVATGVFDPGNPTQRAETYYAGWPGQYATFYTNGVPTTASVNLGGHGLPVNTVFTPISFPIPHLHGFGAPRPPQPPKCQTGCSYSPGHGCVCPPRPKHFMGLSGLGFGLGITPFSLWSPLAQAATIAVLAVGTYVATKKLRLGRRRRR